MSAPVNIHQVVHGDHNIIVGTGNVELILPDAAADAEQRLLRELSARVEQFWIAGQLQALVPDRLILLDKTTRPQAVEQRLPVIADPAAAPLAAQRGIHDIYRDSGRALLILGDPGSGKTVILLELARILLERTRSADRIDEPVPLVLPLAGWQDGKSAFLDWVLERLGSLYSVGRKLGQRLLDNRRLVPLLDGLDEVAPEQRGSCIHAINAFLADPGVPGLVVCCRRQPYLELAESADDRLRLNQAIILEPLSAEQIDAHLAEAGRSLADLRDWLGQDPIAQELARTPLFLDLMSEVYDGASTAELRRAGTDSQARQDHLFASYVERMFAHKPDPVPPYPADRVLRWLAWLARLTARHHQAVFLIEALQPEWLVGRGARRVYFLVSRGLAGMVFGLVLGLSEWPGEEHIVQAPVVKLALGLMFGLAAGLLTGVVDGARKEFVPHALATSGFVVLLLMLGVLWGGTAGLLSWTTGSGFDATNVVGWGLIGGLLFANRARFEHDIRTVERLEWAWSGVPSGLLKGLGIGVLGALLLLPAYWIGSGSEGRPSGSLPPAGFLAVVLLIGTALGSLAGMIRGGLRWRSLEQRIRPNLGMIRTADNLLLIMPLILLLGVIAMVVILIAVGEPFGRSLVLGLIVGLCVALIAGLGYGGLDLIRHYTLRALLARTGVAPRRFGGFLEYAARLRFLYKTGPGYRFPHEFFRQHFAALDPENPNRMEQSHELET